MRKRAGEFRVRPNRVGMIGFSAGGRITSEALFGPPATRPDFAALIYGVHEAKEAPDPAPPLFIAVAADDTWAAQRSIEVFTAYRKSKGLAELHIFQMGAHGFVNKGGGADHFMDRLEEWLRVNKLLSKAEARADYTHRRFRSLTKLSLSRLGGLLPEDLDLGQSRPLHSLR